MSFIVYFEIDSTVNKNVFIVFFRVLLGVGLQVALSLDMVSRTVL